MMTFESLPAADQAALRAAAQRANARVDEIYTRPRPTSEWERRAAAAAAWLEDCSSLTDIGCGSMTLRRMLPPTARYQGVDIVARDEDTIVVDLNRQSLPAFNRGTASALGVMEYLYDPRRFLMSLRQFDRVVFSYCARRIRLRRKHRLSRFWVNHLSRRELRAMMAEAGFTVLRQRRLGFSETLYLLG